MITSRSVLRFALLAVSLSFARASVPAAEPTGYLFSYFTKNGEDGLHFATSRDGYAWTAVAGGRSFLTPKVGKEKLVRDPCVARGPDGTWHMVWTCGWWEKGFGYASTKDFITWSEQREIPAMEFEPAARNTWAPEIFLDEKTGEFLIFWASTIPGKFPETLGSSEDQLNHRIYGTTTKDFVTFTPTKLFYDPGFNCIDATLLRADGKIWMIIKNETKFPKPEKNLRIGEAKGVQGPFGELSAPFTPEGMWVEGPTAIKIGDDFIVYFDAYMKKQYGALRSRDLKTWEDVTAKMSFPNEGTPLRMRHGTVFAAPETLIQKLESTVSAIMPPVKQEGPR